MPTLSVQESIELLEIGEQRYFTNKPRQTVVEEVGAPAATYLFFEFCDELSCEVVLCLLHLLLILALIFLKLAKRSG